jgi:3-hydroxyacyl-CoA dehydrogenase/3a,7a,12a-trihydroxy-5b-cholest-24-enoyl-CoA hydratase
MAKELRFDDKVVIVTGSGAGLGRSHALAFAGRGAKVVVNDLGGSMHGGGKSSAAADAVVAEIKEAGGEAIANYDSVEDGDKIVQTALDTWGRVDVVVNNAGILRDVSFHKMTQQDWDLIYRVHVLGSFKVSHAAWPHMRDQGYGRIIMTASAAGIYGNFGQANYSMAKLGLLGLSNTLAIEGGRKGVHVNTIAPIAGSRLTKTVLPEEVVKALAPEYVSPLVLWLCHEECEENGGLFEVGGGHFSKLRWERTVGHTVRLGRSITPELVTKQWKKIAGFGEATHPANIQESMGPVMENIQKGPSKGGNDLVDVDEALGYEYPEMTSSYDERDLALYALGVGAGRDPLDDKDLRMLYEMHSGGFVALPTFGVIPAMRSLIGLTTEGHQAPGLNYGIDRLLHGEQYTEVKQPLPRKAKLTHKARIKEIWDKGKGALINTEVKSYDEQGQLLIVNEYIYFIRGAGNFGGDRGPSGEQNSAPDRKPDKVIEEKIGDNQALLYRLSGDVNPLHVDPNFAKAFGFDRPILHGLCTFGYAGRHVISAFAPQGDPRYFKSIKVRFAKSVYPGDTLVTEMWKDGDQRILFRCKVKGRRLDGAPEGSERDEIVISNAAIELYEQIPKPKTVGAGFTPARAVGAGFTPARAVDAAASDARGAGSGDVFLGIQAYVADNKDLVDRIQTVFQFKITDCAAAPSGEPTGGLDSVWTINLKDAPGSVLPGESVKPDVTLEIAESDFIDMTSGKADAQKLYFGGKLKISGNVMASQKLSFLQKIDPEWAKQKVADLKKQQGATGTNTAAQAKSAAAATKRAYAPAIVAALEKRLADSPNLADEVQAVIHLRVTAPDGAWTLALKGKPSIAKGTSGVADTTLTIADADLVSLAKGEHDAGELFQRGKLRVDGNVEVARRLGFFNKLI